MRTLFQRGQVVTIESSLPAIERLPADAKVPTGSPHVPPIKGIEQHPLKPGLCAPAQPLPEARQLASLGKLIPSRCSHPDTLPSVTNHSERAQCPSAGVGHFFTAGGAPAFRPPREDG